MSRPSILSLFFLMIVASSCTSVSSGAARDSSADAGHPAPAGAAGEISLSEALREAFERNPTLRGAAARYRAALASHGEAVSLPDPMVQWTHRFDAVQTRTGAQTDAFSVNQRIPFPGKLILKGRIARAEARIANASLRAATRDVVAELKESYHELVYLDRALDIVGQTEALAERLAALSATRVGGDRMAGEDGVALGDALKAQAQLAQLSYDRVTLEEMQAAETERFNRLLNRRAGTGAALRAPDSFPTQELELEDLRELATEHRQEIELAVLELERAGMQRRLAGLAWVPDLVVGGQYLRTEEAINPATPGSGEDPWGLTLGLTLPLWVGKNVSKTEQARHREEAARAKEEDSRARTAELVTRKFYRLRNAERLVVLYRDNLIPQAATALTNAEEWHKVGREGLGRVLEAQGVWLTFNLALARAEADAWQSLARLEQAVGLPLAELEDAP